MIVFEKITLQNFLSYGNDAATLNLQRKNPTLIAGINYDASTNGEMDSNGCGKSSLLMAITFVLYDVALGKEAEKKDNLVNNINKKDLLVELEFKVKKDEFKIIRYRKNKALGGNGVQIIKNGKDITPDSISNANDYIAQEIVKVPYEIFSRIITYAAGEDSFLKLPLAKQREVIEELFSYTELTKKADILKEQIKSSKIDLKYAIDSNEEIKEEHSRHQRSVLEAKSNIDQWEAQHSLDISTTEAMIDQYSSIDFDREGDLLEQIESQSQKIQSLESDLNNKNSVLNMYLREQEKFEAYGETKETRISSLLEELKQYQVYSEQELEDQLGLFEQLDEMNETLKSNKSSLVQEEDSQSEGLKTLESLEEELRVLEDSKCPYCSQSYQDAKTKVEGVKSSISDISKTLRISVKNSRKLEKDISNLKEKISEISGLVKFDSPRKIENYRSERDRKLSRLSELEVEENPYSSRTTDIESVTKELRVLKSELESERKIKIDSPAFKSLRELFDTKQKLVSAVEKKQFLEEQENPYQKSLEMLETFVIKENKSKEIDHLENKIKHQEFLLKLLTKKDSFVRKALMDKYLPFLNERLRYYLNTMGLPHKAQFKSDLSMEISQFDREITFTSLSSGQKARINIALSLAFRDVLQSKHNFINLYILDECLDVGLSNVGVRKTLKLIKEVANKNSLSMFIISHRDEIKDSFKDQDQIQIELRNGFSKISRD